MLNCPDLKIGADNITVEEGPQRDLFKVVYNVTVIPNFCDHLLHVCLNVSTTHPLVGVMFRGQPEVVQWVHVAEVIFYGPEDPTLLTCPTNLVVPGKCMPRERVPAVGIHASACASRQKRSLN